MTQNVTLFLIDPQNDFCNPPVIEIDEETQEERIISPGGALYVPGAEADVTRLAGLISRENQNIDNIVVTLDTHHQVDIAHPIWWTDEEGQHPDPFTIISVDDVESGRWNTTVPQFENRSIEYVKALADGGKYPLCIWPPHCLEGTQGHALPKILNEALREWEQRFAKVDFVRKGTNMWTEHYSAIKAEVTDPSDPRTNLNRLLVDNLKHNADLILVGGEASSHCVANTIRDLIEAFDDPVKNTRIVYLKDCCSCVPGFEDLEESFLQEIDDAGVQITDSKKVIDLL